MSINSWASINPVQLHTLAAAAQAVDGVAPLGESVFLTTPLTHLAATEGELLIGYAWVDPHSIELVVHPEHRRRGTGTALLKQALTCAPQASVWAHGNLESARALARANGLQAVRELVFMQAPLSYLGSAALPTAGAAAVPTNTVDTPLQSHLLTLPSGLQITTFTPADAAAWLDLNARIFASHPEQGRLSSTDLTQRLQEDWFDPTTFWLAWDAGKLVGYVWGKIVGTDGEIYVIGVDACYGGRGIGSALFNFAQTQFAARNLETISLYAEADNRAVRLYQRAGLAIISSDVQFAPPLPNVRR